MERKLFTSESVTEGHPDKICDKISDAILDELLRQDSLSRVACETTATTGIVYVMGEITTSAYVPIDQIARNKIVEYDELNQLYDYQRITGTRVNENTLYIAERLYTEDDFIRTQNPNGTYSYELRPGLPTVALQGTLGPGDIKYADLNHDGVIDSNDKMRGVGHPYNPEINYGFGLNVEYKGFYVSAFFQGTGNSSVLLASGNNHFWPFNWYEDKSNYRTLFLDRWTADNPRQDVTMPRLHSHYSHNVNKEPSTWWLRSGNFLRFKNLEIGYNLPKNFLRKIRLDAARVYMLGNNLCVWDDIKYWDPEQGNRNNGMSYPMSRTFTLGLEVNF